LPHAEARKLVAYRREFARPYAERLARREQRDHAGTYLAGLASDLGRKNAESIAYRRDLARVGHATPNIGPELIITIAPPEHSCGPYGARVRHQRSPL
jgi:hypothetical protein